RILARDLDTAAAQPGSDGCVIETGTLHDPYTGTSIEFTLGDTSNEVHIDHVVSLGDGWQKGAQFWAHEDRVRFANDPANLLAVAASANLAKGDADAATWLPPNKAFRCTFITIQVGIKHTYQLWVTPAEHD